MNVEEAIKSRFSCRAFLPDTVPRHTVKQILSLARQAPSGGNIQPWHVIVLAGELLAALKQDVQSRIAKGGHEEPAYQIYPEKLPSPYRDRRFKCGHDLYDSLGIERTDRTARQNQFARNFDMFGAPVGLFFYIDDFMLPPQWADLGIFLQSVMLLARHHGLHTCAQESWALWPATTARHTHPAQGLTLFCGMALGYPDLEAPVNQWRTGRADIDENIVFSGF